MSEKRTIQNMPLAGISAQSFSLDVEAYGISEYRVYTDTASQITGDKTFSFTGTPIEGKTIMSFIIEGGINTSGASKLKIGGVTVPDRFALSRCYIQFEFYNSAWNPIYLMDSNTNGSVSGSQLIDDTVSPAKITDAIAGSGLSRNVSDGLVPHLEASNPSLQVSADELGVKLNASGAITKGPNGIQVNIEASDPSLQVSANQLGLKIDSGGGLEKGTSGTAVKLKSGGRITERVIRTFSGHRYVSYHCII